MGILFIGGTFMRRFYLFLTVVLFLFFSCANNIADNKNDLAAMLILQNLQKKKLQIQQLSTVLLQLIQEIQNLVLQMLLQ